MEPTSSPFTLLWENLQDQMSARTEHGLDHKEEAMKAYVGLLVAVLLVLMWSLCPLDAWGYEEYILGGDEHPWQESWKSSGEVVMLDTTRVLQPLKFDPTRNIALGFQDRGGFAWIRDRMAAGLGVERATAIFDGDSTTVLEQEFQLRFAGRVSDDRPKIDLGGRFPVNRIVFYPRANYPDRYIDHFRLYINDGTNLDNVGKPIWQLIREDKENTEPAVVTEIPLQLVQFVQLYPWQNRTWEVAELELYGEGYVPEASYTSDIIDFGEIASWGKIRWEGEQDPEGKVFIQTRTGMDEDPSIYWRKTGRGDEITKFREDGKLLTARDYKNLAATERAGTTYDTENWSFWSAPYDFQAGRVGEDRAGGVSIVSPGPNRYFQIRVDFRSTDTDAGRIGWLGFELSRPPAADGVVAEVWPLEVEPAVSSEFVYSLSPTIRGNNTGFNSLEIFTGVRPDGVDYVRIDSRDVDLGEYVPEVLEDRLVIRLPRMDERSSGSLVEVGFRSVVLRYGTEFSGWVYDSESDEVSQLVGSGDASDRYDGDELSVRISLGESLIRSVDVSNGAFSPNGDGINDALVIRFDVLKLTGDVPIDVSVYDLGERKVREVYRELGSNGRYETIWDGKDDEGKVVLPGIYMYRICVESDVDDKVYSGSIAVVH